MTDYNEFNQLYVSGVDPEDLKIFRMREEKENYPEDGIYAMEDWLQSHRDAGEAFVEATLDGWRYAAVHREETLSEVIRRTRQEAIRANPVHMQRMLDAILLSIIPGPGDPWRMGDLSRDAYQKTGNDLLHHGSIPALPDYESFISKVPGS